MSNTNEKERFFDNEDTTKDDELGIDEMDKVSGGAHARGPEAAAGKGRTLGPEAASDKGFHSEGPEKFA